MHCHLAVSCNGLSTGWDGLSRKKMDFVGHLAGV